jgi:hypothetical protein
VELLRDRVDLEDQHVRLQARVREDLLHTRTTT